MNQEDLAIAQELLTIRDFLRWAMTQFYGVGLHYGHGTDNAWDEAINLILRALKLPFASSRELLDARLSLAERKMLAMLIMRRVRERIPVAYLLNEAWFAGLAFYVDQRVLIPRSGIFELIENKFSPWITTAKNILDIGTGSGCIAIACALAFPDAKVSAVDISADALAVAAINVAKHRVFSQVELVQSDIFANLRPDKYDIIVSNPPYVGIKEWQDLPAEYYHEPRLALVAEEDGLVLIKRIIKEAKKYLTKKGILVVEVGNSMHAIIEEFPQLPFTWLELEHSENEIFILEYSQL